MRLTIKLVKEFLSDPPPPPPDKKKRDSSKVEKTPPFHLQKDPSPKPEQKSKGISMNVYQGRGKAVTDPVDLEVGLYRIDYQFSEEGEIHVLIVNLKTGERDYFVTGEGLGARTYYLKESGRFVFEIYELWKKNLSWKFAYQRLE